MGVVSVMVEVIDMDWSTSVTVEVIDISIISIVSVTVTVEVIDIDWSTSVLRIDILTTVEGI